MIRVFVFVFVLGLRVYVWRVAVPVPSAVLLYAAASTYTTHKDSLSD